MVFCESSGFKITVAEINLAVSPALTFNEHQLDSVCLVHVLARPHILFGHIRLRLQMMIAAHTMLRLYEGKHAGNQSKNKECLCGI